jgi:hypothetical protein
MAARCRRVETGSEVSEGQACGAIPVRIEMPKPEEVETEVTPIEGEEIGVFGIRFQVFAAKTGVRSGPNRE